MRLPAPLRPGDTVAVVAPSSAFEPHLGWRGLGFLAERYRVRFDRSLFSRRGYLAGEDERRRDELDRALRDPDVRAIVAARGGYGATRFVHELDFGLLERDPRWIVGFSDITALHLEATRVGVGSLHGCHLTALGRGDAPTREALLGTLEDGSWARYFQRLEVLVPGRAEGPLVGGNLTLVHAMATAGRLVLPPGAVLLLEDVTERPYRIDRMLTGLLVGGHLRGVGAVVLGEFFACEPGPDGVRVEQVFAELLPRLGVPVLGGLPVGHGRRNEPLILGAHAEVVADPTGASLRVHREP